MRAWPVARSIFDEREANERTTSWITVDLKSREGARSASYRVMHYAGLKNRDRSCDAGRKAKLVDVLSDKLCGSKFHVPKPHILYIIGKISIRAVDWYQV